MNKISKINLSAEKLEDIKLDYDVEKFGFNEILVAQAVRVEDNHIFSKFGRTQTKGEVKGGGKKPWKQKGTGRARAGSIRSPLFKGGGVTFGPTGESKTLSILPKMRRAAFAQIIAKRMQMGDIAVVEDIKIKSQKTKDASSAWKKIFEGKPCLLVCSQEESSDLRAWNNLPLVDIIYDKSLLIRDFLRDRKFIFTNKAFERVKRMFR